MKSQLEQSIIISSSSSQQLHDDDDLVMMELKKNNNRASSRSSNNSNRKKIRRSTTSSLPEEIIDEILYRLPVKSLSRFKCVCKRWLSTISDPGFNVNYKRESNSVFAMSLNEDLMFFSIDDDDDDAAASASASASASFNSISVPPLIVKEYNNNPCQRRVISNACNGLVLLRIVQDSLVLFNPSTRSYSVKAVMLDCLEPKYYYDISIGLCYDPSIHDYKALLLQTSNAAPLAHVSCLKTKQWVKIHVPFDDEVPFSYKGPLLNGRMHWIIGTRITYFEATRNTFEALPSPPDHHQHSMLGFGVLDGCLCLARKRPTRMHKDVEVVAMKKYGVAESWTTLYVLSNITVVGFVAYIRPLHSTKNGEEVLFLTDWNDIWAYNPASKSYRKFDIPVERLFATSLLQTIVSPTEVGLDAK